MNSYIIKIIYKNYISNYIEKFNNLLECKNDFFINSTKIINNPLFNENYNYNFENINLDSYFVDIINNNNNYVFPNSKYSFFTINNISSQNDIYKYFNFDKNLYNFIIWKNPIYKYNIIIRPKLNKITLQKIFIISRHGPREPIFIPPKFIKTYWKNYKDFNYNADLTDLGKHYSKHIGELLYKNYKNDFDFNSLNNDNIIICSTNFDRTIQTAILTLDGIGLTNKYNNISIIKNISDNILDEKDHENYIKKFNTDIEFDINLSYVNEQIEKLTGMKINTFKDYYELATTIKCYEFNNYQMLNDIKDNESLNKLKSVIYYLSIYYYNFTYNPKNEYYKEARILGIKVYEYIKLIQDILFIFLN
jgi:hypothetical protein